MPTKERTYNQYCPIAHALDLIGDRWALLIVRDLFLGPKRFTDLVSGLPGIGTNVLTARLKQLERADIVRRRFLPPPAASSVYELTEYGRGLEEPLSALALWGAQSLGAPRPGQTTSDEAIMLGIKGFFSARAGRLRSGCDEYEARIEADTAQGFDAYAFRLREGATEVSHGGAQRPCLTLSLSAETLVALFGGNLTVAEAQERGTLRLDGDSDAIKAFLDEQG